MALRRICGSPVSSDDEAADVFAYDEQEKKRKRARPKRVPPAKAPRVVSRSKKELVREAPPRFVAYLAEQLSPATQAQFCEEFGFGQGYMLRLPTAWAEVRERREFGEWATQLGFIASTVHRHLYRISSLNVEIVLAELRARGCPENTSIDGDTDVSMVGEVEAEPDPAAPKAAPNAEDVKSLQSKRDDAASLMSFKEHFQRLDNEQLEMLSVSEHDRLLSTIRHEQIADAMEEVLARPSVRKERDRARRMSKLGRIAERRLSIIPMRPSVLPSTILEGPEWEDEEEEGFDTDTEPFGAIPEEIEDDLAEANGDENATAVEQLVDAVRDGAMSVTDTDIVHEPGSFTTPRKPAPGVQTRRSSIGVVQTPGRDPVAPTSLKDRRSSVGFADSTPVKLTPRKPSLTPLSTPEPRSFDKPVKTQQQTPGPTPQKTPLRTPGKTPRRTPLRTPRRISLSGVGVRRSSITKAALTEIKRWKLLTQNILGAVFSSGYLDLTDLKAGFNVSKVWREVSLPVYAWSVADYSKQLANLVPMEKIYSDCPRGHYLSDGAYKEVFKVYSARHKRLEAVSVMDVRAIENTGNQHIVRQEVAHSLLLSELVRSRYSPHFVEIYDVFLTRERPETMKWGSASCRKPVDLLTGSRTLINPPVEASKTTDGLFQYIHMEFCDGGDIEDFIALQEGKLLPVNSVVIPFFFQMVFSIYSARERFHMRHCDIKLLNFFLKDISRRGLKCAQDEPMVLQYAIGDDLFNVQLPATFSYWVKLADYGTADSNLDNLGKPVTLDQFTTLENTPVEFLLEGDQAQQSFAADTFSLGLCLLHLFTGSAPYEEILETVKCPAPLLHDLKRLWMSGKKNSPFSVLRRVCQDDPDDVLIHTLYRYLVLFGLPDTNPSASRQFDRVWAVLVKHLRPEDNSGGQPSRQSSRRAAVASKKPQAKSAKDQFQDDQAQFSIVEGCQPIIQRARERLDRVPGAQELLLSLVAFDPSARPTMKQTLFHDVFKALRSTNSSRPVHYSIDCYAAEKVPVDRLPDV